jgi:hypothetical protein
MVGIRVVKKVSTKVEKTDALMVAMKVVTRVALMAEMRVVLMVD